MSRYNGGGVSRGCLITLVSVIAIVVLIGSIVIGGYNKAVRFDEDVKGRWAQVDTALKRRFDLIPNLVETVKGYASHEEGLFTHIADARTKYFSAQGPAAQAKAAGQLQGVLSRLLLLQERYPQLKANEGFLKLQDQLEGSENRIATERKRYNDSVKLVNTYRRSFFGRFFCTMAGVDKAEYFEIPESQKEVPTVKFN